MQIDGTIEFKPQGILSDVLPGSPKKLAPPKVVEAEDQTLAAAAEPAA